MEITLRPIERSNLFAIVYVTKDGYEVGSLSNLSETLEEALWNNEVEDGVFGILEFSPQNGYAQLVYTLDNLAEMAMDGGRESAEESATVKGLSDPSRFI